MIHGESIVHEVRYPHPLDEVWRAITQREALATWLMPNDFVAEVGHRFRFDARPAFSFVDGEVLEIEPPTLLRCRWTIEGEPTTLTIRLRAVDGDTVLNLRHDGMKPDPRSGFDGGWGDKLRDDLPRLLSGSTTYPTDGSGGPP